MQDILDVCLGITGGFEGGKPSYTTLAGNADGQSISAGILQWPAGQGTLQHLVRNIGNSMGWEKAVAFFPGSDIKAFSETNAPGGLLYAKTHYLQSGSVDLKPVVVSQWKAFLATPESQAVQRKYAEDTVLAAAISLAKKFVPEAAEHNRVIAYFFDLATQQGSMRTVEPLTTEPSTVAAMTYAFGQNKECAQLWNAIIHTDALAAKLLYYAYERGKLGNPGSLWDTVARRGTIACRKGIVHKTHLDFTHLLD